MTQSEINVVNQEKVPVKLFLVFWITTLIMSGVHTGLIVFMNYISLSIGLQIVVPMIYWGIVAAMLTLYTRYQLKKNYEEPMINFAKATSRVAHGDFSVYVAPLHTIDKHNYLDVMIKDFNKMVEELGSIETLKTDFFSNVSHEFKTPLSVIQNNAQLINNNPNISQEKLKEYIGNILSSAKRLSSLITNMLKLNRLEKQVIKSVPVKFDLCEQLCDSILQFEKKWNDKNIDLNVDMEERIYINSDEELLSLVWTNLISNAIKFTPENGVINIIQTSDEKTVKVTVMDNGCGMNEKTIKHIFDKFYQGDNSHATEGNGLGLALVHRILELLDGTITVESRLNEGSKFTVTLNKGEINDD